MNAAVGLLAAALVAGCASTPKTVRRDAATPDATPAMIGTWQDKDPEGALELRLSFSADGHYAIDVLAPGARDLVGTYRVDHGFLTLVDDRAQKVCAGATSEYVLTVDGGELRLVCVRDDCAARPMRMPFAWRRLG